MVLLFKLEAILVRPRKLAELISPESLKGKTSIDWERRIVAEHFSIFWTQPRKIVCLRRRSYTGKAAFRFHLRPCYTVAGEPKVVDQSIGLICEYDEATRVLRAVSWEVVTLMPLSELERIFEGDIYAADFNYGVLYSDTAAVEFLTGLPDEPEDLRVPLAKWREYLVWRQKLAEEKAKVRYEFSEASVLPNRKSVRLFLKDEQVLEQLKTRFVNEELKILPLTPTASRRPLQGAFESIRAEERHENSPRGRVSSYHSNRASTPKGTPEKLSLVLRFDDEMDGDSAMIAEGVLQLSMEGELSTLDVQIQGLARLAEGRALNSRLRTWLFDVGKAPAITDEKSPWRQDSPRKLNPEQQACVERALAMEDLLLLWGPPGTGKTTVIAEICPICAPRETCVGFLQANLAVTQALERLPHLPHLRPVFISSARKRENLPRPTDFIRHWFADIRESVTAQIGNDVNSPWNSLLSGWKRRLEEITPDDFTVGLTETYLRCANVVGATCNEAGKPDFITSKSINSRFDLAIVDEVSKATPPEMLLPMPMGATLDAGGRSSPVATHVSGHDLRGGPGEQGHSRGLRHAVSGNGHGVVIRAVFSGGCGFSAHWIAPAVSDAPADHGGGKSILCRPTSIGGR
jgi:hypothetical protein